MEISNMKGIVTKSLGRGGLVLQKYSPEILMGVGIVGIVAGTVLACKATLKVNEVLEETQGDLDKIHKAHETMDEEKYSQEDYQKDLVITYAKRGVSLIKLYGPSILIGAASVSCLLGSHVILSKRNIALVAAYKMIEEGFEGYRNRVRAELGEEKERAFRYGITETTDTEVSIDAEGKKVKNKVTVETVDPTSISPYARFFDETSIQWQKSPEANLFFLKSMENYANDLLRSRGHLFLNEVYDMIGVPRSKAGSIVGWVNGHRPEFKDKAEGDNYVDFGIYDGKNGNAHFFVNGYERSILLDFNVDGVIYDLL